MKDDLTRRISDALDAEGGLEADEDLRALLESDLDARAYAQDLVRIGEVLHSFAQARAREPDWEALAAGIEERLGDELAPLEGVDRPPALAEDGARAPSRTRDAAVSEKVTIAAAGVAERSRAKAPAPVADLAARRSKRGPLFWLSGLAAAAAVGLGITFGMTSLEPGSDMRASSAPTAQMEAAEAAAMPAAPALAPATDPAWGPSPEPAELAVAEPPAAALPAAASVAQIARETSGSGGGGSPARSGPSRLAAPPRPAPPPMARRGDEVLAELARPGRADVLTAMRGAEPAVQRCLAERGQVARVAVQVGADGSVVSVRVDPPYIGAEASCIVEAVRRVRLPPSLEDYPIAYSFRPAPVAGGSAGRPPAAARARAARATPAFEPPAEASAP